jgi:hypothetical protein
VSPLALEVDCVQQLYRRSKCDCPIKSDVRSAMCCSETSPRLTGLTIVDWTMLLPGEGKGIGEKDGNPLQWVVSDDQVVLGKT